MDEQKNGTPAPRRRRRADAQRTVISEDYTDSFQPEEAKRQPVNSPALYALFLKLEFAKIGRAHV